MIAIYVRVSTEEQVIKGFSIDAQIDACIKKAGTTEVLKYIDEGWSGEIIERPSLMKLRDDVRDKIITSIICYDPDRLSRNLMLQLILDDEFKKNNVQLIFVNGEYANTPEGQMFFQFRGAISQFEKAKIKQRTMSGRRQKAKNGIVVKDGYLFGYDYDKKSRTYVINEDQARIVRMIFDWYTSGKFKGINSLALHLTEIGIPTAKGGKVWHRQVVRQILLNESYTGMYYQNKYDTEGHYVKKQSGEKVEYKLRPRDEWIEMKIPAIIDEEQFDYSQQLLGQGRRRYDNYIKHNYLLSGLVRCGRCGGTMTGRKRISHGKDFYVYACRKNYAGAKDKGCGKEISENKLNNAVWEYLKELFDNPVKISEHMETKEDKTYLLNELDRVEKEIEKNKKGRKRLITLVSLDEDLDLAEVKDQMKLMQEKENELIIYYTQIKADLKDDECLNEGVFHKAVEEYLRRDNITIEDKKHLINTCVKEIVVSPEGNAQIHLF